MAVRSVHLLPGEDPQEYAKLKSDLFAEFKPSNSREEKIMSIVVKGLWLMRRWHGRRKAKANEA